MADAPHGTIYVGVTSDLAARVYQHRQGRGSAFCRKYGLKRLVYTEEFSTIEEAIGSGKHSEFRLRILTGRTCSRQSTPSRLARLEGCQPSLA
jgi:predicted GIY-YIG superfamily endonuclease